MKTLPPANADERAARTVAVLAKYRDRAFSWRERATCIHVWRAQAVAMGHRIPPMPDFHSAPGARKALRARGAATLVELLDALLPNRRIAPAAMWVGDVLAVPGDQGFEALWFYAGGGAFIGWTGQDPSRMHALELSKAEWSNAILAAWRLG